MEANLDRILVPPPPAPTGFNSMIDGDTIVPPPLVAPPPDESWAAHVLHEFFDHPAPSYGTEKSFLSLIIIFFHV
jgi:hypothetical protein